jgi:large subunit ribosomal protein L10
MRPEKISILQEARMRLDGAAYAFLVGYQGLTVEQIADLRGRMRAAGGRVWVARNSFIRKAASDLGYPAPDEFFKGSSALVSGKGDPTAAAKLLRGYTKERPVVVLKGGWMFGRCLGAKEVDALADLPPREILLGIVVGTIAAPLSRLVGVLNQKVASIVYVLKAIEEKKKSVS